MRTRKRWSHSGGRDECMTHCLSLLCIWGKPPDKLQWRRQQLSSSSLSSPQLNSKPARKTERDISPPDLLTLCNTVPLEVVKMGIVLLLLSLKVPRMKCHAPHGVMQSWDLGHWPSSLHIHYWSLQIPMVFSFSQCLDFFNLWTINVNVKLGMSLTMHQVLSLKKE